MTGDVARIDADGFIHITDRLSRFSKIGGEMVPHIRIEEAIRDLLQLDEDELRLAVAAVPDEKKGERLVVLHTGLPLGGEEICRRLAQSGLPPIWIPAARQFPPGRGHPRAGDRQARPEADEGPGAGAFRARRAERQSYRRLSQPGEDWDALPTRPVVPGYRFSVPAGAFCCTPPAGLRSAGAGSRVGAEQGIAWRRLRVGGARPRLGLAVDFDGQVGESPPHLGLDVA